MRLPIPRRKPLGRKLPPELHLLRALCRTGNRQLDEEQQGRRRPSQEHFRKSRRRAHRKAQKASLERLGRRRESLLAPPRTRRHHDPNRNGRPVQQPTDRSLRKGFGNGRAIAAMFASRYGQLDQPKRHLHQVPPGHDPHRPVHPQGRTDAGRIPRSSLQTRLLHAKPSGDRPDRAQARSRKMVRCLRRKHQQVPEVLGLLLERSGTRFGL